MARRTVAIVTFQLFLVCFAITSTGCLARQSQSATSQRGSSHRKMIRSMRSLQTSFRDQKHAGTLFDAQIEQLGDATNHTSTMVVGRLEDMILGIGEALPHGRFAPSITGGAYIPPTLFLWRGITVAFVVAIAVLVLLREVCAHHYQFNLVPRTNQRQVLQGMLLSFVLIGSINSTVLIPSSYNLASSLGWGATASGWLLGCGYMLAPLGAFLGNRATKNWDQPRLRRVVVAMLMVITAVVLLFAETLMTDAAPGALVIWRLCLLRSVNSVAFGFGIVLKCMCFKATPSSGRVQLSVASVACTNAGFCLGPLLGSAVTSAFGNRSALLSASVSSALPMYPLAVAFGSLCLVFSCFAPDELETLATEKPIEHAARIQQELRPEELSLHSRKIVILVSAAFCLERGFTVSAIEAATALILELQYSWTPERIGFGIGSVFAITVTLALIVEAVKSSGKVKDAVLLPALASISVLGTLLLVNFPGASPHTLFAGDAVVYSCAYTVNGVMEGLASRAAIPNSWYSIENYMLARVWLGSMARFISPAAARYAISNYSRNVYVIAQFSVALCACVSISKVVGIMAAGDSSKSRAFK